MKKLINYSFNGICSIFRSSAKNNEFFSDQLKKLNEYNFNLLLAMTTIVILLPLNIISINRLLILSCIIHIGVNISASFSNKDRNKNINKKNILGNPTPYPILITISSITGITTLALVFTKFSILHKSCY